MDKYQIAPADIWVVSTDIDISEKLDASSPYYYFLVDFQELVSNDKIHTYKRTVEQINDASRIEDASLLLFELNDDNHQLIFHAVDLIRDGVRYSVLDENNISVIRREKSLESHITDNRQTVSFSIDDLRVGDIIDYQATDIAHAGEHPLNGKLYHSMFWLNWDSPVYLQKVRIINRSKNIIQIQTCTYENGIYNSMHEDIKQNETYAKEYKNLGIMSFEDVTPVWLWPDFLLAATKSEWEELSAYLYEFYDSHGALDSNINIHDLDIVETDNTIEENIIAAVRFVQNEIRYKGENHGIFTHTPKSAENTLVKRYGDCKDKSNLLATLLRQLNVNAHLTLVNTDYGIKISHLSPSLCHFNHMIVHVALDGKNYYFDTTIKKQAGDLEHSTALDYGYGLLLSKNGLPLQTMQRELDTDVYNLKHIFDLSGEKLDKKLLKIARTYYSYRADNMRFYIESTAAKTLADDFLKFAKEESDLDLSVEKPLSIIRDDTQHNILQTEEVYSFDSSSVDSHDNQLHIPTTIYTEFPTTTNRDLPLRIGMDGRMTHDIEVIYQHNFSITHEKATINNEWFCYQDSVSRQDNVLHMSTTATPKKKHVSSNDIKNYLKDVEVMRLRSVNNFSLYSNNRSQLSSLGNWMMTAGAGLALAVYVVARLS